MLICAAVSGVRPSTTTSKLASTDAVTPDRFIVVNSLSPSARSISAANGVNWLSVEDVFFTTRTGPPGPLSSGGGAAPPVVKLQLPGAIVLPAASWAPLTAAVYVVFVARAADGVSVAVAEPESN